MGVSCITMRQVVYKPVDIPSSVSKSGLKSFLCLWSFAYASTWEKWALGRGVCILTYPGGTPSVSNEWAPWFPPGATGVIPGRCGVGSGLCWRSCSGGGSLVPLHFQRAWRLCAVPYWPGRKPSICFSRSKARCLSIAAFTWLCPEDSTRLFFSSRTSAWGFFMRYCISFIVVHKNFSSAIFAIFKARRTSECSSCTRPPCLSVVADILKTYKKCVSASTYQIRLLPQPYTPL